MIVYQVIAHLFSTELFQSALAILYQMSSRNFI